MSTPLALAAARDRGQAAHAAAVAHLAALAPYSEWSDEEEPDPDAMPETAGPWDGCETCVVRESLAVMWPHALAYAADLIGAARGRMDTGRAVALLRAEITRSTLAGQDVPA